MTKAHAIVAAKAGGTEVLSYQEITLPAPTEGQILIRQHAIGVNFIDIYFRTGAYPWPVSENLVLGQEGAGIVEAIGPNVSGFSIGDRVACMVAHNAYATHRLVPAVMTVKLPDNVTDAEAAASMLKGMTAYYLITSSYAVKTAIRFCSLPLPAVSA